MLRAGASQRDHQSRLLRTHPWRRMMSRKKAAHKKQLGVFNPNPQECLAMLWPSHTGCHIDELNNVGYEAFHIAYSSIFQNICQSFAVRNAASGMRAEEKNRRYCLSAEDFQKIQGYDDLQKQLDEAKALLAQCQDPQGLVKSLQESAERIRLLEKENVDLSRILTNYVSNPAMLPCRAADASIKRELLVKREVPW